MIRREATTPRPTRPCPPEGHVPGPTCPAPTRPGEFTQGSPGTPRHPAYASGHSTYSAAASFVMQKVFEQINAGLPTPNPILTSGWAALANNIGEARFWGGVHWYDDHTFGQRIGTAVGERLWDQLTRDAGVPTPQCVECQPPETTDLESRECRFIRPKAAPDPADLQPFRIPPGSRQGAQG